MDVYFSDEERLEYWSILDEYRTKNIAAIRKESNPRELVAVFGESVNAVACDVRLPVAVRSAIAEMIAYCKTTLSCVVSEMTDRGKLSPESTLVSRKSDEEYAKDIIEITKEVAHRLLEGGDEPVVKWNRIPFVDIYESFSEVLPGIVFPEEGDPSAVGQFAYKGGVARIALKVYVRSVCSREGVDISAIQSMLDAELPSSDKDAIVGPFYADKFWNVATVVGVDLDGIELRPTFTNNDEDDIGDMAHYFGSRDADANQVLLTSRYLYFTDAAFDAIKTGIIHSTSRVHSLFGTDSFVHHGRRYQSPRMVHRLVKLVAEGRAIGFEIPRYNAEIPMGIYWLVLARRWMKKDNAPELLARMYLCAEQLGQLQFLDWGAHEGVWTTSVPSNVCEFLEAAIERYPQFTFESAQTAPQVAVWILERFYTMCNKTIRSKFDLFPEWPYNSSDESILRVELPYIALDAEAIAHGERARKFLLTRDEVKHGMSIT